MKLDFLDIILTLVIIALIVILAVAVSRKVPEPFTELYFNHHTSLPKFSSTANFSFSINNLENQDFTYAVQIRAEGKNYSSEISSFNATIPDQEIRTYKVTYTIPPAFGTGRIIAELVNKNQSIHFWTTYAHELRNYFGKEFSAECLPVINATAGNVTVKLSGNYSPNVVLLKDGEIVANETVDETRKFSFTNFSGILDIWFTNDYYNKTFGVDRNLYLEYVKVDDWYYPDVLVDKGSGLEAFDCQNTLTSHSLYSNGAFRLWISRSLAR